MLTSNNNTSANKHKPSIDNNGVMLGIVLAILAGFLFVSSDTVVKLARQDLPVAMVVWGRFTAHFLLMLFLYPGRIINKLFKVNNLKLVIFRGILLLLCTCLFFTAIGYIGLAEANLSLIHI